MNTTINVANITVDYQCQQREAMDYQTVGEYARLMADGVEFPPVTVFRDGETVWLSDGFHRLAAARAAGKTEIACDVHDGGLRDAILHAVTANTTHGLQPTREDKRHAVTTLLEDAEWCLMSDREIARRTGTSHTFVSKMRRQGGNVATPDVPDALWQEAKSTAIMLADEMMVYLVAAQEEMPDDEWRDVLDREFGLDDATRDQVDYVLAQGRAADFLSTIWKIVAQWDPATCEPTRFIPSDSTTTAVRAFLGNYKTWSRAA